MLGILLSVLRILGIVLLVLLAVLLVLLLMVLFVPVRYDISGRYFDKTDCKARTKVTYLLHLISFEVSYVSELKKSLKVFGISVDIGTADKDDKKEPQDNTGEKKRKKKENADEPKEKQTPGQIVNRLKAFSEQHDIGYTIHFFIDQLAYILNQMKPRKVKVHIDFGFENPAYTGWTLAGLSTVSWIYNDGITINPDFEVDEMLIKGEVALKGKISPYIFVVVVLKTLLDKEVRRTLFGALDFGGSHGK